MSTVIIVDSACELPTPYLNSRSIKSLPLSIEMGKEQFDDPGDPDQLLRWVEEGFLNPKHYANSDAAEPEQIQTFLVENILPYYDNAIVQTVSRSRSNQFDNWATVNQAFASQFRKHRPPDSKAFSLSLVDSGTAFSGQALLALETLRLAKHSRSRRELLKELKSFTGYIQAYSAPADLGHLRKRARQRGDNTVGLVDTLVGKALNISPILFGMRNELGLSDSEKGQEKAIARILNHATKIIQTCLASPIITVSYAGPLSDLDQIAEYTAFKRFAEENGCKLVASVASLSDTISLGPGNFGLAIAASDPTFVIAKENK